MRTNLNVYCTDENYEVLKNVLPMQFRNTTVIPDDAITRRVNWNRICIDGRLTAANKVRIEEFCQGAIMAMAWLREGQRLRDQIAYRYMVAHHRGDRQQVEAYLGFGSEIHGAEIPYKSGDGAYVIIRTMPEHTEWQAGRLMSGMRGGYQSFENEADARREATIMAEFI